MIPFETSGNETGRPIRVVDGSGMYECKYDALGNVTDETRTIALPQHGAVYQFKMHYDYDSWGRMLSMTYPDSERIKYKYQWGGDLYAMYGDKNGDPRTYIKGIRYNAYGQKVDVDYGNGTSAHYTYDALHRLVNLKSRDHSGTLMQNINYTFDNASNVTNIVNSAGVVNTLGGDYKNIYKYDALHRLVGSNGGGAIGNYDTYLKYSPSGRLITKYRDNQSVTLTASVDMYYGYCNDYQPHAVKRMFDYKNGMLYDMRWDEAGNLGQVSMGKPGEMFERGRFLFWTEDSRMHAAVDEKYFSYYVYDHSGERRLKLTGINKQQDVNADLMATYTVLNEPTLYPSAYMVLSNKGYTKHYYAGTERVAARLGGGGLNAQQHVIANDDELQWKANKLFKQSLEQVNHRVLGENDLNCIMRNKFSPEVLGEWIEGIPYQVRSDVKVDNWQFKNMIHSMLDDPNHGKEKDVYFYHSDHLGSASWITDYRGKAVQHIQYLPYGEPYINQRPFGYSERFTFTGKERDEETGYGYFGARYMDHELMTMWLSVDPMADKYPSISPYAYCAWNPVKLVDPDGREIDVSAIFDENGNARKGCEIAAKALMAFANSKFGHRALSLFAKKGDKVGNVSFDKDGLFHEKHIDLSFNVASLKDCAGNTGHELTGSGKSKRLMLSVNLDNPVCGSDKDNIIRSLETICHEMFFHVFNYANDFDDDQNLNNSEISEYYRKKYASDLNAMQEYHDLYVTHRYRDFAIPIMQEHLHSTRKEAIATLNGNRGIIMSNCPNWHKK